MNQIQQLLLINPAIWMEVLALQRDLDMKASNGVVPIPKPLLSVIDGVAYVDIAGVLTRTLPNPYFSQYYTGYDDIAKAINSVAADMPIVLRIDSPGGSGDGIDIALDAIKANSGRITAEVDGQCCSAAYWLASQTSRISATRLSEIGSIGAYSVVADFSKYYTDKGIDVKVAKTGDLKGIGIVGTEVTEEQMAALQHDIEAFGKVFFDEVKQNRNSVDLARVTSGKAWIASEALELNLIDKILTGEKKMTEEKNATPVVEENKKDVMAEERKRVADILATFSDKDFCAEQIESGATLTEAKAAAYDRPKVATSKAAPEPVASAPAAEPEPEKGFLELAKAYADEHKVSLSEACGVIAGDNPEAYRKYARGE